MTAQTTPRDRLRLILASQSPARRALLARLERSFEVCPADIDESAKPGESPPDLAQRLADEKAQTVASRIAVEDAAVIIASDQIAMRAGTILGKPGDAESNARMLADCSGATMHFLTAVCVLDSRNGRRQHHIDETRVRFRKLSAREIARYIAIDEPWQCAGGFKAESAGISLFESIDSQDPSGLIGLPLIFVSQALRQCGWQL